MISNKRGRPTRKEIANTIIFEEPNGDTFYFTIDKKGNSKLAGTRFMHSPQIKLENSFNLISDSSENASANNSMGSILTDDNSKISRKKRKVKIEMDKFDEFLSCLEYQINFDSFFNDHKLSENMLPKTC